jgi:hypothetical protein
LSGGLAAYDSGVRLSRGILDLVSTTTIASGAGYHARDLKVQSAFISLTSFAHRGAPSQFLRSVLIFCDRDLQLRGAGPYSGSGAAYLLRNFGQTKARKSELPESRILGLCPKVLPHFAFAFNPISIVCSQHPRQIFFSFASSFAFSTASASTTVP